MTNKLSNLIKEHRKKSGLGQSELAKLAGCGKTTVFNIEHGKMSVQFDTLLKILKILNIKLTLEGPLMEKISLGEEDK